MPATNSVTAGGTEGGHGNARAVKEPVGADAVLVVPSRPGAVLDYGEDKSLPVAQGLISRACSAQTP